MLSSFKSRIYVACRTLLISGVAITTPVQAQIDVDKIVNDVMKEASRGLVASKSISPESFKRLFGRATTKVNKTAELKLARGTLKGIASKNPISTEASGGSWRVMLTSWRNESGDDVFIQQAPAVIMNHGNRFQYIFFSQDIAPLVYDRVNEKLAKLQANIIKEYKDVQIEIGRNENKMVLNAVYAYNDDDGDIEKRLVFLMNESRSIIHEILAEAPKAEKDARNDLGKQALTYLNRDDFVFLIDDGYEKLTVKEGAKEGHWEFSNKATKASYEIFNFGDRIVLSMYEQMPAWTSDAQRDGIVSQVNELVTKKPAKGANSMEVLRYPDATDYVWVKANFALDGKIKGKEIAEYYTDFKREYAEEFHNKIMDVFKDTEKAAKNEMKDMQNKAYSFLTQAEYILLADDDLEGDLKPDEGVQEGHWNFTVGEEKRECEIFNYGDRIVYALAVQMPVKSEETRTEITEKVQALLNDLPADKSSDMDVTRYPGYENYVWVKATYTLDGSLKGKDINKQYRYFTYDYSEKLHQKVSEIMDAYR